MNDPGLSFVIGGAQKSGTTTLAAIFRQHPQIQMSTKKETHFFDDETRDWDRPDYRALDAFFPQQDGRLRGEATPVTLYWRPAIRRLRQYNRDLKFILLLRNPVTRAFANWCKEFAAGLETLPFAQAIRDGRERVRAEAETEGLHRVFSYVERGFYGTQLSYLLTQFSRSNIHCEIFEEFVADRAAALERMAVFLGIDAFPNDAPLPHLHSRKEIAYPSTLTAEDAAYLGDLFRDDATEVEAFMGRPIPAWRTFFPPPLLRGRGTA